MQVEFGLSKSFFDDLSLAEVESLQSAFAARLEREARRDAQLFALLCNLHGNGKRVWKVDDFISEKTVTVEGPEAEAAIRKYRESMAARRLVVSPET